MMRRALLGHVVLEADSDRPTPEAREVAVFGRPRVVNGVHRLRYRDAKLANICYFVSYRDDAMG